MIYFFLTRTYVCINVVYNCNFHSMIFPHLFPVDVVTLGTPNAVRKYQSKSVQNTFCIFGTGMR